MENKFDSLFTQFELEAFLVRGGEKLISPCSTGYSIRVYQSKKQQGYNFATQLSLVTFFAIKDTSQVVNIEKQPLKNKCTNLLNSRILELPRFTPTLLKT